MTIEDILPAAEEIYQGDVPRYKWSKFYDYFDSFATNVTRLTMEGQFLLAVRLPYQGEFKVRAYLQEAKLMENDARQFSVYLTTTVLSLMGLSGYTVEHNPTTRDSVVSYVELQRLSEWVHELWKKLRDTREEVERQRIKLQ